MGLIPHRLRRFHPREGGGPDKILLDSRSESGMTFDSPTACGRVVYWIWDYPFKNRSPELKAPFKDFIPCFCFFLIHPVEQ